MGLPPGALWASNEIWEVSSSAQLYREVLGSTGGPTVCNPLKEGPTVCNPLKGLLCAIHWRTYCVWSIEGPIVCNPLKKVLLYVIHWRAYCVWSIEGPTVCNPSCKWPGGLHSPHAHTLLAIKFRHEELSRLQSEILRNLKTFLNPLHTLRLKTI